jgi:hypothetical protein
MLLSIASSCADVHPAHTEVPAHAQHVLAHVPIVLERNHVRLPVTVLGPSSSSSAAALPFQIVLDTGMPTPGIMLYASERVDALGLRFVSGEELSGGGSGGPLSARIATGVRIEIGGLVLDDVSVIVLPRPPGFAGAGEGVIGNELFQRYAVRVSSAERELELLESESFVPDPKSRSVPLRMRNNAPFVDVGVAVGPEKPVVAELALDLGASHSLWLNGRAGGRFEAPAGSVSTRLGRGISGEVHGQVGRVRRFELGGFVLENVVTVFPQAEYQRPGGVDFKDGFVGAEILTRFDVVFDYARQRMLLKPGDNFSEPFEYDMTGMVLDPGENDQRIVTALLPGSPAEECGVQAGDVLVAVDGEVVRVGESTALYKKFRKNGAELHLVLRRGSDTLEKTIRLRRLV